MIQSDKAMTINEKESRGVSSKLRKTIKLGDQSDITVTVSTFCSSTLASNVSAVDETLTRRRGQARWNSGYALMSEQSMPSNWQTESRRTDWAFDS